MGTERKLFTQSPPILPSCKNFQVFLWERGEGKIHNDREHFGFKCGLNSYIFLSWESEILTCPLPLPESYLKVPVMCFLEGRASDMWAH